MVPKSMLRFYLKLCECSQKQIVHMNVHKNKKMLGTILKDIENSMTLKITFERPEIQVVNVFNSI